MRERRAAAEWAQRCPDLRPAGRGKWAGPCPLCGGVDRFHVETCADGRAIVGCRGCIDGLPQVFRRKRFGELVRAVWLCSRDSRQLNCLQHRPLSTRVARTVARSPAHPEQEPAARLCAAAITDPGPVRRYLSERGAWPPWGPLPDTVRWLPVDELIAMRAFQGLPSRKAMAGAMVCTFRLPGAHPASAPVAVNVETLTCDGRYTQPRFRKDRGPKTGTAFMVRPGGANGTGPIHVAEGETDALAISCWRGVEAWAAGGARGFMPKLAQPLILAERGVVIEADWGEAGECAAVALLEALAGAGADARIEWAGPGADPADMLSADWRAIRDELVATLEHSMSRAEAEQTASNAAWEQLCPIWFPPRPGLGDTDPRSPAGNGE